MNRTGKFCHKNKQKRSGFYKFMKKKINIAIGTDGPASNNALDMFREMFLTTALAKYFENDASAVDANEVLKMATLGGAKAMGLYNCDTLSRGKKADLIVICLLYTSDAADE